MIQGDCVTIHIHSVLALEIFGLQYLIFQANFIKYCLKWMQQYYEYVYNVGKEKLTKNVNVEWSRTPSNKALGLL